LDINARNYKSIFNSISIPTYIWKIENDEFRLVDYNKAAELITEGKISNFLGSELNSLYEKDSEVFNDIRKCFYQKLDFSKEMLYTYKTTEKQKVLYISYKYLHPNFVIVYTVDITKQKEAENLLKQAEREKSIILESIHELIVYHDLDHNVIWANKAAGDSVKRDVSDLIGDKCYKIWHNRDKVCENCPVNLALSTGNIESGEVITPDRRIWNIRCFPVKESGKVIGAVEFTIDVTEQKKAEQKLKDSELQYRNTIDSMGDAIHVIDTNLRIILYNPAITKWVKILNMETDILGKKLNEAFHFLPERVLDEYKQVFKSGKPLITDEETIIEGKTYFTESRKIPIIINDKVKQVITIVRDISERKISEKKLKESEERFKRMADGIRDGLIILEEGKVVYMNYRAIEIFGYPKEELMELTEIDLAAPEEKEKLIKARNISKQTGQAPSDISFWIITKNGKRKYINNRYSVSREEGKALTRYIVTTDFTEYKEAEENLKASEERYREAYNRSNFYKDIFAHDINNIFQNIQSSAELLSLLLKKMDISKGDNFIDIIKEQIIRGSGLISSVRKLSEIEDIDSQLKKVEVNEVLYNVRDYIIKSFYSRKIDIEIQSEYQTIYLNANELLEDIFENILINGIRYNNSSIIELQINVLKERSDGKNYVKLEFLDNGIGIPDEMKEKIFQRGYNQKGIIKGLGLGLTLVKKIIAVYKGDIWVEDKVKGEYSKGSKFIILLPEAE